MVRNGSQLSSRHAAVTKTGNGVSKVLSTIRPRIVTAVGPDAEGIAPGDKVLFLKESGYEVRLAGTRTKVVRRHELIARIQD